MSTNFTEGVVSEQGTDSLLKQPVGSRRVPHPADGHKEGQLAYPRVNDPDPEQISQVFEVKERIVGCGVAMKVLSLGCTGVVD